MRYLKKINPRRKKLTRTLDQIDYPKTAEEWWLLAAHHKDALLDLVRAYHPYYRRTHQYRITAPNAEGACETIRKEIQKQPQKDPCARVEESHQDRTDDLYMVLNETWFGMPESTGVRCEQGFGVLCDLCSEGYVLEEEELPHD